MTAYGQSRRARYDECAPLTELAFRSKAAWGYSEQFMADCRDEISINETDIRTHRFFVLESDGAVIGLCAVQKCGAAEGILADMFVEPARMRTGRGRHLPVIKIPL